VDRTRDIAEKEPRVRFVMAPRGRASQMNAGAQQATGEWLLFPHADTILPDRALIRLNTLGFGFA
jgi:glycosyltransferase involved in cell wall biosynthesis